MKKTVLLLCICISTLTASSTAWSQSVKLPETVKVPAGRLAAIKVEWEGSDCRWAVPSALDVFREYDPDPKVIRLRVIGYEDGEHRIIAVACKDGKLSEFATCVVMVGKAPKPEPPGPKPDPSLPAPIPVAGFRVLIVCESSEQIKLSKGQLSVMYGEAAREWMVSKAAKVNGSPEVRIYDKDINLAGESKLWKDALARPRTGVPWLLVSNGTTGWEGVMPESLPDIMAIMQKYAKE